MTSSHTYSSMLRAFDLFGGIYRTLHELCQGDDACFAATTHASKTCSSISYNLLQMNPRPSVHMACYVGSVQSYYWIYYLNEYRTPTPHNNFIIKRSCLKEACIYGHLPIVRMLFEDYNVNKRTTIPHLSLPIIFNMACENGHLYILEYMTKHINKGVIKACITDETLFHWVCANGHLSVARWLLNQQPRDADPALYHTKAFQLACHNGHLHVAQWLWGLVPICHTRNKNCAFRWACRQGHLHVAQWLWELDPSAHPHLSIDNWAFRWACYNGHLHVAQWLVSLKPHLDVMAVGGDAFLSACSQGNVRVVRWLWHSFPQTRMVCRTHPQLRLMFVNNNVRVLCFLHQQRFFRAKDILVMVNNHLFPFFENMCCRGYLAIIQWLHQELPEIPDTILDGTFMKTCRYGHLHVIKWLEEQYPQITTNVHLIEKGFIEACDYNQRHVVKWLYNHFPFIQHKINHDKQYRKNCMLISPVRQWLEQTIQKSYVNLKKIRPPAFFTPIPETTG